MKKTTIICDGCKKEITPAVNRDFPRVSISMEDAPSDRGFLSPFEVSELCKPCFRTIREALKTALQACDDVGKDDLPQD
jgi:hypothetical protein